MFYIVWRKLVTMTSGWTACYFGGGHLGSAILDFRIPIFVKQNREFFINFNLRMISITSDVQFGVELSIFSFFC